MSNSQFDTTKKIFRKTKPRIQSLFVPVRIARSLSLETKAIDSLHVGSIPLLQSKNQTLLNAQKVGFAVDIAKSYGNRYLLKQIQLPTPAIPSTDFHTKGTSVQLKLTRGKDKKGGRKVATIPNARKKHSTRSLVVLYIRGELPEQFGPYLRDRFDRLVNKIERKVAGGENDDRYRIDRAIKAVTRFENIINDVRSMHGLNDRRAWVVAELQKRLQKLTLYENRPREGGKPPGMTRGNAQDELHALLQSAFRNFARATYSVFQEYKADAENRANMAGLLVDIFLPLAAGKVLDITKAMIKKNRRLLFGSQLARSSKTGRYYRKMPRDKRGRFIKQRDLESMTISNIEAIVSTAPDIYKRFEYKFKQSLGDPLSDLQNFLERLREAQNILLLAVGKSSVDLNDAEFTVLYAYWVPANHTFERYYYEVEKKVRIFMKTVIPITEGDVNPVLGVRYLPKVIWVKSKKTGKKLALAFGPNFWGRHKFYYTLLRWIPPDMEKIAIARELAFLRKGHVQNPTILTIDFKNLVGIAP